MTQGDRDRLRYWLKYALFVVLLLPAALLLSNPNAPAWVPVWLPSGWTSELSLVYLMVVAVSGRIVDAASTVWGLRHGLMESAPGIGKRPSATRLARLVLAQGLVIAVVTIGLTHGLTTTLLMTLIAIVSFAVTIYNLSITLLTLMALSNYLFVRQISGEESALLYHPNYLKSPNEWGSLILGLLLSLPFALLAYGNVYARLCFFLGVICVCKVGYSAWRWERRMGR